LEGEDYLTKAVLISCGGDPLLVSFVLKLWKKWWYPEVDKIYVCFNTEMDKEPVAELFANFIKDPKISFIYHPYTIGYGEPIRQMLQVCREDLVMLLEDDGFIFRPGIVEGIFKGIENGEYDAAGSPRRSCGQEIWDRSKEKYNLNYEGLGDKGPNFWPNFFFCKRKDLLKTDMNFAPIEFQPGEYCHELDYTFKEKNAGDTFVWTSMQLREMGLKFKEIPQYHASPFELQDRDSHQGNWIDRPPTYLHGGSLSSGWSWNGFLLGRQPIPDTINGLHEIETRVAFWTLASDMVDGFEAFKIKYREGIAALMIKAHLDQNQIRTKYNVYKELMGI
jgi:hypothetical protein